MPFRLPPLTPAVRIVVFGLAGLLVLQAVLEGESNLDVYGLLALSPRPSSLVVWAWQPLTYVLVEPLGQGRLVIMPAVGLFFLYFLLAHVELRFGARRTWEVVVAGVLGGAVPVMILGALWPASWPGAYVPVHGAGVIALAAVAVFAGTYPEGELRLFGVVGMKPWHLVVTVVVLMAGQAFLAGTPFFFISSVGAIGAGLAYVRWGLFRPRRRGGRASAKGSKAKRAKRKLPPYLRPVDDDDEPPRYLN
ncbi:MAG: hypothetical protein ACFCGT_25545 [Sandaracinaceae bacterium]